MSLKSLKARLDKIRATEPEPEQARHSEFYESLKQLPHEKRKELRDLIREDLKFQAEEQERQERERRRQEELRAPAKDPVAEEAAIDNLLQNLRDKIAAKKAEAQRRDAALLQGNTQRSRMPYTETGANASTAAKDTPAAIRPPPASESPPSPPSGPDDLLVNKLRPKPTTRSPATPTAAKAPPASKRT